MLGSAVPVVPAWGTAGSRDTIVITVVVAARSASARRGLETLIGARDSLRVTQKDTSRPLWQRVEDGQPDVLVVDLDRQPLATALSELARVPRPPVIVVLTDDLRAARTSAARQAGVRAALPRGATAPEIIAAIEAVAAGLIVLHPGGQDTLPSPSPASLHSPAGAPGAPLTGRETEVLNMIAEGLGNKVIAARLGISEHTVKFHVASIFSKLGAGSRTEAVTIGVRRGLIMI